MSDNKQENSPTSSGSSAVAGSAAELYKWLKFYRRLMPVLLGITEAHWLSTYEGKSVVRALEQYEEASRL